MALEAATTIDQLVISNPLGTDNRSQGDDHIRLIKSTLKNTFPEITGPVTVTQDQINSLGSPGVVCFPGMIVMWSGTIAQLPPGWKLCDGVGTISNGNTIPDLRGKFVIGTTTEAGGTYNIGQTGGAATQSVTGTTGGTALTVAQLPSHNHTKTYSYVAGGALNNGFVYNNPNIYHGGGDSIAGSGGTMTTNNTGSGATHNHTISATVPTIPPYYALALIIKD